MAELVARIFGATALNEIRRFRLQQNADAIDEQLYNQRVAVARATLAGIAFG